MDDRATCINVDGEPEAWCADVERQTIQDLEETYSTTRALMYAGIAAVPVTMTLLTCLRLYHWFEARLDDGM